MGPAFSRKYNTATDSGTHIRIPMVKRGVVDVAVGADWTPAAGDVKVSKDGGAAANIATLPTAVAMGNGAYWEFTLSATELSCKLLVVTIADAATKAVEDNAFLVETFGHASAMYPIDWTDAAALGLSRLDATVGSRAPSATALSTAQWTNERAVNLDKLDAQVTSRADAAAYTAPRAAKLDSLDVAVSSRADAAAYTADRAAKLDQLDAAVSSRATPVQVNAEVLDVVGTDPLVDGKSLAAAQKVIAAAAAGKVSGAGTGTETFLGLDGTTPRAIVTVDESGNRSAVSYP